MIWLILLGVVVLFAISVTLRLIIFNFPDVFRYGLSDLVRYFRYKGWNKCPYGTIRMYIAHNSIAFGCGKTLSAVREVVDAFQRYDGVPIWDRENKKFVTQRIVILSNVDFKSVPYMKLESLAQFVQLTDDIEDFDRDHDTFTVFYMLIDEASSQLNSRSFKSNFDAPFISRLLTSRHVHANLILTSQRSGMVDKLMRDCCNVYVTCHKLWRFVYHRYYDAYKVEVSQDLSVVAPFRRTGFFATDNLFKHYDTMSMVQTLKKSCQEGDMLSEAEIIALRVDNPVATGFTRRERKRLRKARGGR